VSPGLRATLLLAAWLPAPVLAGDVDAVPTDGARIFAARCVLCHGESGHGDGRASRLYAPPPADLTASWRTTEYKLSIVREGGGALGRSPAMPPWGGTLSDEEITAVVRYIDDLVVVYEALDLDAYCACSGG
jgi:mono/diheme cytochrome c family protein